MEKRDSIGAFLGGVIGMLTFGYITLFWTESLLVQLPLAMVGTFLGTFLGWWNMDIVNLAKRDWRHTVLRYKLFLRICDRKYADIVRYFTPKDSGLEILMAPVIMITFLVKMIVGSCRIAAETWRALHKTENKVVFVQALVILTLIIGTVVSARYTTADNISLISPGYYQKDSYGKYTLTSTEENPRAILIREMRIVDNSLPSTIAFSLLGSLASLLATAFGVSVLSRNNEQLYGGSNEDYERLGILRFYLKYLFVSLLSYLILAALVIWLLLVSSVMFVFAAFIVALPLFFAVKFVQGLRKMVFEHKWQTCLISTLFTTMVSCLIFRNMIASQAIVWTLAVLTGSTSVVAVALLRMFVAWLLSFRDVSLFVNIAEREIPIFVKIFERKFRAGFVPLFEKPVQKMLT